jgi:hypothetical protein
MFHVEHFQLFRGLCFSETDRTTAYPRPFSGSGIFDCATAAASNSSTSGRFNSAALGNRKKRFTLPLPCKILWGSRNFEPLLKDNPTPLEFAANETRYSDGRSLGPYPMTKKL